MADIQSVIRQINQDLVPQFEERLRGYLAEQDREWLIEQIIRLALDAHSLQAMDRKHLQAARATQRAERAARLRAMGLNVPVLRAFLERTQHYDRDRLIGEGYLLESAPVKGTDLIAAQHRAAPGQALLGQAKDMLFGLLFGDQDTQVDFNRKQRELLTFTLPRFKASAIDFMQAATEMAAAGTWQDPESVSNDARADNVMLEVEFGEIEEELIGDGIVRCLSLINNLEINEQILYARMLNVEQTTLIE